MALRASDIDSIFPSPPEGLDPHELDLDALPAHVAIIMDGNGRWAEARGMTRSAGHKAAIGAVREVITACNDIGVGYLTLYSFSTENWKRPAVEVADLMGLFADTMAREIDGLDARGVRMRFIGHIDGLPKNTRQTFVDAQARTSGNPGMTLAIAANYGSRTEIADAARVLAGKAVSGEIGLDDITPDTLSRELYTADMPDPDLLIRTSGEMRISNFLLWQIAYSEIYVTDVLFPDYNRYDVLRAIVSYQQRERRFGSV